MPLDPGTRLGPYEIRGPLAAGGMGEVYRTYDARLDRLVAVKVLPAESASSQSLERFEREARAIAALNHPGICSIYDVGKATLVETGLARISETTPSADEGGTAIPTAKAPGPLTDKGATVGTVAYMSPEQLGGRELAPRTDLFSLGLLLYEAATGRRAFAGTTSAVTTAAILHEQPKPPRELRPELPPRLGQAILTLLEQDRDVRTQTASVSPDGNYVAYVEQGAGGSSLRVRQVKTSSNVEILTAERGVQLDHPTVTPDGTFVDYLRRVAPQPWELWQIPFLGGPARQLLTGVGSGVGFSHDGRQMAYVRDGGVGQTEVVVTAPDGSGPRGLATRRLPDRFWTPFGPIVTSGPGWPPNGTTLAANGGTVPARGQLVFLDTRNGTERTVDFSPSMPAVALAWLNEATLLLAGIERSSTPLQLWLMSYPQGALRRLTNDLSHHIGASLTADGNELVTMRAEGWFSVWTSDASGARWTEAVPRTPTQGPIGFGVRWLGDDLVFPSLASGRWALERWRASTRSTEILGPAGGLPQVSRDGSTLVYWDYDAVELWKLDADGRNKVRLEGGSRDDRITPDGRQLTSVETGPGAPPTVRIRPIDGRGEARDVTADHVRPGSAFVSPDGRFIAYTAFDDRSQPAVAVCEFANCVSKRTFPPLAQQWTPDSQGLAYVDPRTPSQIWVQPLDGSAPRRIAQLAEDGSRILDFAWSSDSRRLAVGRYATTTNIVLFRGLKRRQP